MKSEYGFNSEEISEALVKHSSYYDVWHRVIKCVNYFFFSREEKEKKKKERKEQKKKEKKE